MTVKIHESEPYPYHNIIREERYYCSLLHHLLLDDQNMRKFLELVGIKKDETMKEPYVYVEYAVLRDIWYGLSPKGSRLDERNKRKKALITRQLNLREDFDLLSKGTQDFNEFFGVKKKNGKKIL